MSVENGARLKASTTGGYINARYTRVLRINS